jgi:UDPglucose 6-dehydrogenase
MSAAEHSIRSTGRRRVCVVGAGYVGLPSAGVLAHRGHDVILAERDPDRMAQLLAGGVPILEPGLDHLLQEGRDAGRLSFQSSAAEAVVDCDFVFLCVPTPQGDDGSADLSYIESAAAEISPHLRAGAVVVNKSTVPVGTVDLVARIINRSDVSVVSSPEFLREGTAVADSLAPDRIVVGADNRQVGMEVAELFGTAGTQVVVTTPTTAEMIKYASNAFLAAKLSYVNEIATICEAAGADISDLVWAMGLDHRIGAEFLNPGPGWGGSCFPKDTEALVSISKDLGHDFNLLRAVIESNERQFDHIVDKVAAVVGDLSSATVAIWGLAFKANTDDRRSSPAVTIAQRLLTAGATVKAFDPTVTASDGGAPDLSGLEICGDAYGAASGADVVVVLTEWPEFLLLDFDKVGSSMRRRAIVDGRNLLDPALVRLSGFSYVGVGRS